MNKTITVFKLPADGSLKAIPDEIRDKLEDITPWAGMALLMMANDMRKTRGEADDKRGS